MLDERGRGRHEAIESFVRHGPLDACRLQVTSAAPISKDTLEFFAEDIEDVTGIAIDIPLNKKGADILFVTPSGDFLADPGRLDLWSFGTWHTEIRDDGLVRGRALQSGATIWLRIVADPATLLIDYHLGTRADALAPRIFVRIVPR